LIAFAIIWALLMTQGIFHPEVRVDTVNRAGAAAGQLQQGDRILSIDGKPGWAPNLNDTETTRRQVALRAAVDKHRCPGGTTAGCVATSPATVVVQRGEERVTLRIRPHYVPAARAMLLGITYAQRNEDIGPVRGAGLAVSQMWGVTKA